MCLTCEFCVTIIGLRFLDGVFKHIHHSVANGAAVHKRAVCQSLKTSRQNEFWHVVTYHKGQQ